MVAARSSPGTLPARPEHVIMSPHTTHLSEPNPDTRPVQELSRTGEQKSMPGGTSAGRMTPREHGAYAELLFPMAAIFLGARPTAATWLIAIAAIACFLANEPLLVLFGHRGPRAKRERSGVARRSLVLYVLVALAAGIPGLWLAPSAAQYAAALPLVLGFGVVMIAAEGLERSAVGESLAAAALSSVAVPLGLASGLTASASLAVAAVWFIASSLGTAVVHLTLRHTRAKTEAEMRRIQTERIALVLFCLLAIGTGLAALLLPRGAYWILAATLPMAVTVAALAIARPTAQRLRSLGWGLVFANVCSLLVVVAMLRVVQDFNAIKSTLPFPMF